MFYADLEEKRKFILQSTFFFLVPYLFTLRGKNKSISAALSLALQSTADNVQTHKVCRSAGI